ncbi:hypothetical protein OEZ86_007254 [Tetradesmus obliquus]|nr:hypothetical protein OEZ86_007254 [Tetradesmus obliquus]
MAALQKHRERLTVYLHDSMFKPKDGSSSSSSSSSSFDLVSYVDAVMPGNSLRNAYYKEGINETDVAIFVSPEFSIGYYREFIRRARPRMLIVFIHEPNMDLSRLQYIINMHPLVGVAALSPHVAATVKARMRMHHVHWMMPVHAVVCANTCFEGWAVQGKFEGQRRSYSSLWEAMANQLAAAAGGSGAAAVQAAPARLLQQQQPGPGRGQLRPHVFLYRDLGYADYYDTLCRSQALLPLFNASSGYLRDKISSSVLASLAAGVPLMVPRRFLEVYEAIKEEHVLLLDDSPTNEPGAAELASIAKLSGPEGAATLAARRKALAQLRHVLNQHAAAKLDGLMAAAASRPHASTKQD